MTNDVNLLCPPCSELPQPVSQRSVVIVRSDQRARRLGNEITETTLYVMGVASGYYKIGIAKNPWSRRKELQTGNPEMIGMVFTSGPMSWAAARQMERAAHDFLSSYRCEGEWFNAPLPLILRALRLAATPVRQLERWQRLLQRPEFVRRFAEAFATYGAEPKAWQERKLRIGLQDLEVEPVQLRAHGAVGVNDGMLGFVAFQSSRGMEGIWCRSGSPREQKNCADCGEPFTPQRSTAQFCSDTCRQRAHRKATA